MPAFARLVEALPEAASIRYNNLVYEMRGRGEDVIVLSLGEAFFDLPLFPFDDLPYPELYHYSHSRGLPELRERLARDYRCRYGVPVDPEREIIVTAGSKMALYTALMAILDPGDEVVIHEPAWVSYAEQVRLCHGRPVMVPYQEEVAALGRYVTGRTRAIVVNYPHNPRGAMLSRREMERLHELADERDIYLIADEAYSDFVLPPDAFISFGALDPDKRHTIICNSMSKNHGISGWRLGYLIAGEEATYRVLKLNQHLITCPPTILQMYVARNFDRILAATRPQIRAVVERQREVRRRLEAGGLPLLPGSATFYLFVSIADSSLRSEAFCTRLLREHGVSAVPGVGYGRSCDRFVRASVGAESLERTLEGFARIGRLLHATSRKTPALAV